MAFLYLLFLSLAAFGSAFYQNLHPTALQSIAHRLQGSEAECQAWIFGSTLGAEWFSCIFELAFTLPAANASNYCETDYSPFCTSSCYQTIINGFEYLASSGVCDVSDITGGSTTDGCNTDSSICFNGTEICYQDNCESICTDVSECYTTDACTPPDPTMNCVQPAGASATICLSNATTPTITPTMQALAYSFMFMCAKDSNGDYCLNVFQKNDALNITACDAYGCCLGTLLQEAQYCLGITDLPTEIANFSACPNAQDTCPPLPTAKDYCTGNPNGVENLGLSFLGIVSLIFANIFTI